MTDRHEKNAARENARVWANNVQEARDWCATTRRWAEERKDHDNKAEAEETARRAVEVCKTVEAKWAAAVEAARAVCS